MIRPRILWMSVATIMACGSDVDHTPSFRHEAPPRLSVGPADAQHAETVLAAAEAAAAPEIRFLALVEPDANHATPLLAPTLGTISAIRLQAHARRGDTLAMLVQEGLATRRQIAVISPDDGTWLPRRGRSQTVWKGDTLGLVQRHGYWLAVGSVSDVQGALIHPDDPATVEFGVPARTIRAGRVESLRPSTFRYSVDVAVEFRGHEDSLQLGAPTTVAVTPAHPEDSLAAVPASAVVQLGLGSAVFVPTGSGLYEVRWIIGGPPEHGRVVVRTGLKPGTSVVAEGLAPLLQMSQESLASRNTPR